ncbi:MAG: hypothetical protein KBT32_11585 [Bacteroidales bacterium]|nr:hypothetical protein [Candidatus Physcocola equi]
MATLIANPIYDSVFKYMIANEKVAKILLSANINDEDMQEVIRTLKGAASDASIRRTMMLEDEILGELKDKDLTIENQKEQLAEQKEQLAEQTKIMSTMAKTLFATGKNISEIASLVNLDEAYVAKSLED